MKKNKLLLLLALLMTAATGAWADETLLLTIENKDYPDFKSGSMTFDNKVTITFSNKVSNDGDNYGWYLGGAGGSLLTVAGTNGYTITSCKFYTDGGVAATGYTVEGESPSVYLSGGMVYTDDSKSVRIGLPGINKIEVYTAASGSGSGEEAQTAKHLITAKYRERTRLLEQPLPYETTVGALFEAVTGEHFSDLISTMSSFEMPLTGISSNNTSVVSIGELNGASTPVTVIADGEATVGIDFSGYVHGILVSAISPLYANMKDGVKDAEKWTVKVGDGEAQALPVGELSEGNAVTLKYNGRLKVKGVKATSDAAPVVKPVTLTLGSMPNGGDPFSGSSGSGAYSQTFAVGGQIAIIYKNTSNESVKVVTDALTAADISNEGKAATINVSIDDADKTQGVTYIYPAAMANDDGTINCDFKNQDGTVTAIYSGSGAWDGDALPSATMESQQNIVKFTLQDNGGNALSASSLTISAASKKLVASKGFIIKSTTHSGYTYDGGTSSTYGEAPSNLVDGKKSSSNHSKWCTSTGDKVNGIWYCEFHTASAVQVNGYTITTGNDNYSSNNRNPKDWVLKAKAKAGDSWTTIATVTNDATLKDENCKSFDFNVDVHGTYQYFRFEVSATRGADVMQIEELELFKCNYGTAYGDLTVTPASATSVTFVALRNENASADTYTVSAKVGEKKYGFSKSGVTFQNGKYYEITVKMTEQAASTVEWNFSEMSGENPRLSRGYTYKDVTLSGEGDLNFDYGNLMSMGSDLTFTAPTGKHFKKIVITATGMADIRGSGWTNGREPGNYTSTWTGDASSVTFSGMADGVTSIVFTLE